MKLLIARVAGLAFASAILAACSGNAGMTPSAPTMSVPQAVPQAAGRVGEPDSATITPDALHMASSFRFMKPHFFLTQMNAQKAVARPHVGYPSDLVCMRPSTSGACFTMPSSAAYNVYVSPNGKKCRNESCWGNPEEFLKALAGSSFAGLNTQYTGGAASGYTFGGSMSVTYPLHYDRTMWAHDIGTVLAQAILKFGATGPTAQYHIFLPPGYDTCFERTNVCYSPDRLKDFSFCAYHSAVAVPQLNTFVVFSIEPYQNAKYSYRGHRYYACQNSVVPAGTDRLNSGTASTLSHESEEAWSDPIPNSGWFNPWFGQENADMCAYRYMFTFKGGGNSWYIQQNYSNKVHGCDTQ